MTLSYSGDFIGGWHKLKTPPKLKGRDSIVPTMRQIVDVWSAEDWDWVSDGCADVSYALWRIAQKLNWDCKLITGNATVKGGNGFAHVWLVVNGRIFDPVSYANNYKVLKYDAAKGDPAEQLKIVRDYFGVETDEDAAYGFDAAAAIKQFGLVPLEAGFSECVVAPLKST